MKPNLLLIFTLLFVTQARALEPNKPDPSKQVYGGVSVSEDKTLKKLLQIQEVADQYKKCQDLKTDLDKIPTCLWSGLDSTQREKIKTIYANEEASKLSNKAVVSEKDAEVDVTSKNPKITTNLTDRTVNVMTNYKSDPAVKALSAFFGKKLDEVLNGSAQNIKDKKIVSVDHQKFIDLYTSELGKSIINAFTSYCMESNPDCRDGTKSKPCLIPGDDEPDGASKRKANIEANLKTINGADFSSAEGEKWTYCIATVTDVCYKNTGHPYSKQRACVVMDFVKSSRKNLMIADEQKKFYEGLQGGGDRSIASISGNMIEMDKVESTADKLTQITAADIDKDFKNSDNKNENISKINDNIEKEADDCVDNSGNITTKDKCRKFIDVNTTKNADAVTEFGLRQFVKGDVLEDKLKDKSNVGSYLKEEGYSDKEIKDLTSSDQKIEDVKKQIKDRFNDEKDAIIKEMASRISSKTTAKDGAIEAQDTSTLGKIKTDLASRNDDLKNLIHFNNIVSSYLNITDGTGDSKTITRNTASLFAEVKSMDQKDAKEINDNISKNKDLKESPTTSTLQIGDINKILKYDDNQGTPPNN